MAKSLKLLTTLRGKLEAAQDKVMVLAAQVELVEFLSSYVATAEQIELINITALFNSRESVQHFDKFIGDSKNRAKAKRLIEKVAQMQTKYATP